MKNSASGPNTAVSAMPVDWRNFSPRCEMPRGSRLYASLVPVSAMVQVTLRVGTAQNGSMKAVEGSGMASMSEASIDFHPRIDEPSKPKPSSKTSSVNSPMGQEKCCQVPKVSTNFTSTILAPCLRARSMTLLGVGAFGAFALLMDDLVDDLLMLKKNPARTTGEESLFRPLRSEER